MDVGLGLIALNLATGGAPREGRALKKALRG
jgi:hypothetical protein